MKTSGTFVMAVLLSVCIPFALYAGGEQEQTSPDGAEITPVRYVVPGTEPTDSPMVDDEVSKWMQDSGLNLGLERIYVGWDVWQQKTNVMMASGDEFELIHIMEDWIPTSAHVSKGALQPIDELLPEYGPALMDKIPEGIWEAARIDGKVYAIPVFFRDFSRWNYMSIQKEIFDEYGFETPPPDWDTLVEQIETILENETEQYSYLPKIDVVTRYAFHRSSPNFPFTVIDTLFYISQDGEVEPWLDTADFRHETEKRRQLYEIGLIPPDILTMPREVVSQMRDAGLSIFSDTDMSPTADRVGFTNLSFTFYPDKPGWRGEFVFMNSNGISGTTVNPQAGVQFFNWLYSSQANHDLMNWGIEGRHWEDAGPGRYEPIANEATGSPDYSFGDWEMAIFDYARIPLGAADSLEKFFLEWDDTAENSVAAGFAFDPTPVSAEYTNVLAELEASVFPVKYGVVPYDTHFEDAREALRRAGYDEVVAEFKRQFDIWYAAKYGN